MLPDVYFPRIWDIPYSFFEENDIRGVILDIDGTLAPDGAPDPDMRAAAWVVGLEAHGIRAAIVSNNNEGRVAPFAEKLGIRYQSKAFKPSLRTFGETVDTVGVDSQYIAVIGDQLFTDMQYAKNAGCLGIMVEHEWPDIYPFVKFKRLLEAPFMPYIRKKKSGA